MPVVVMPLWDLLPQLHLPDLDDPDSPERAELAQRGIYGHPFDCWDCGLEPDPHLSRRHRRMTCAPCYELAEVSESVRSASS